MSRGLSAGEHVGPYELLAPLGEGGMGQVWKARDTRLNRSVAIKFSKQEFNERFTREAHTVAALNHPHICTLHDVGPDYLVMEYVEGAPLHGPLPVEKVVQYAGQILDALEAAHRKGIIHRDLKPANILLTKQGIKLLDFGLAKHSARLHESDETLTEALTGEGRIVGTLQYMAPEQLQGKPADARSDLFSFGCVLYEMLTGKRAFTGESAASVIAAILEREPAPLDVAPPLERVVRTCLKKDPDERFQTAIDLKRALGWTADQPSAPARDSRQFWLAAGLAALSVAAGFALHALLFRTAPVTGLMPARITRLTYDGRSSNPAVSPDGKLVVYSSQRSGFHSADLYLQQVNGGGTVRLTEDPENDTRPCFSADGTKVYFVSGRVPSGIYEMPVLGGSARLLVPGATAPSASPDGKWIAYVLNGKLTIRSLDPAGRDPVIRSMAAAQRSDIRPVWTSDSRNLVAFMDPGGGGSTLALLPVDGSPAQPLPLQLNLRRRGMFDPNLTAPMSMLPGDELLFRAPFSGSVNLWRLPLREAGTGQPVPLTWRAGDEFFVADARAGLLAFASVAGFSRIFLWRGDLDRGVLEETPLPVVADRINAYHQDVTADGKLLAYACRREGAQGIWLKDLATGGERLLAQAQNIRDNYSHVIFSPDGKSLAAAFSESSQSDTARAGWAIWILSVLTGEGKKIGPGARIRGWSRDAKFLVLWQTKLPESIAAMEVATGETKVIVEGPGRAVTQPRLSPDGRWIAFITEQGLAIAPFRGAQAIPPTDWRIIAKGASFPFWSPNGRNFYYFAALPGRNEISALWRQPFDSATGMPVGKPMQTGAIGTAQLASPMVNQVIGSSRGVFLALSEVTSDVWVQDLVPR